jgi:NAD(P)H-hydrate epimerase
LARLFPELAEQPALQAAQSAAVDCSGAHACSVLLKGARTVVAGGDGRRWQLSQACSAAARAGLGDVLAGYAGGLAARAAATGQGVDAALLAAAALAHAQAGEQAMQHHGHGGAHPMAVAELLQQQETTVRVST